MKKYLVVVIFFLLLQACKNDKTVSKDENVKAEKFIAAYDNLQLPFTVSDTNLLQVADTSTITYAIFTEFVPDSIFNEPFGKDRKFTIHPLGKVDLKDKESYFATLVKGKNNAAVYLSVFDKNKFKASMPLVFTDNDEKITTASLDKKFTISINKEWAVKDDMFYNRTIYAYNNVGVFTTVLTETNTDRRSGKIITNPLDTFPKKYKYSGDYVKGLKNIVSVRDGKNAGEYLFFVYFENGKDDETCGGEIRGSMKMVSDQAGVFKSDGDPCQLNFNFTTNSISVKETGSCGNYRGIRCFFNDTYIRKKETKAPVKKK